jgi:small-conductance mechanosensitive channel
VEEATTAGYLAGRIDALREHFAALLAAAPGVMAELARVHEQVMQDAAARGPGKLFFLMLAFIGLGLVAEAVYRRYVAAHPARRLAAIGMRAVRDIGGLAIFSLGSVAVFLAFEWPTKTRGIVIGLLTATILLRLGIIVSRILLSPRDAALRIMPASDAQARFWHLRIALFAGWLACGWVIAERLAAHGMEPASRLIVVYLLGVGLLAIAVESFWRTSRNAALIFVLLWALWVAHAMIAFWLVVVAFALPGALRLAQAAADHVMRPEGAPAADGPRNVAAATLGRALRALVLAFAAWLVVRSFGLQFEDLAAGDTLATRLLRGGLHALVILLVADVAWVISAALIDQRLASAGAADARLRTLLPIIRGTLAAVLLVMAVLMALSALGIEIGPLLAGAGVVGIAVGFGAQTLVRDLLSKFFYLLDDAFRLGEYIQSGTYKGTVEHLGARSIRLRHHRGPVYTIPYGQLGAVQNQSRDWVIDKLTIAVSYDTDLDKAKKLIKQIGKDLAKDPEFAPHILEPLKMQGVEQFGDYGIQIRMKMMTKPGEQFVIRRKAFAQIRTAFTANGIHFASPTVQVANQADAAVAAAHQVAAAKNAGDATSS